LVVAALPLAALAVAVPPEVALVVAALPLAALAVAVPPEVALAATRASAWAVWAEAGPSGCHHWPLVLPPR